MEINSKNLLKQNLIKLFLKKNTTPPYLQIIQTCVQAITYVAIILGYPIGIDLLSPSTSLIIIALILKGLLLLRKLKGLSLIRFVYPIFLGYILTIINSQSSIKEILILILLSVLIIIDVVSSTSFDFYSTNIFSQELNICKIFHYIAMIFGVTQSILLKSIGYNSFSLAIYIFLWLAKKKSICLSKIYKQLMLRIYMWIAFAHLMKLILDWVQLNSLAQIIIPIIVSQIIMEVYLNKNPINFDQLYSQQNYLKLSFQIMIYLHGERFNQQMEKQINTFLCNNQSSLLCGEEKTKEIHQKIILMLSSKQSFQQSLILSQIYIFHNHQLLKSKLLIQIMKRKVSFWSWIQKICIFRVEQTIKQIYTQKNKQIHFQYYNDYYNCDEFRSLLLKSSIAFISLWDYTKRPEIVSQRFRQLSNRVVKMERKLKKVFKQIQTKCLSISLLYISYLLQVARDPNLANIIVQTLAFNEDFQVNLYLDEKVFVQLSLQEQLMHFQKVGYNISSLLGFQKKEIQGQGHQILLPQFYRKSHNSFIQNYLATSMSGLYLYNKKSIARNKWGYYEQCDIILRLHYDLYGNLVLQGYLQISANMHYNWNYYLFINSKEQIIECSQTLSDYAPSLGKFHKASEVFKQVKLSSTLIQRNPDNDNQYHHLLVFKLQDTEVMYYVRANNSQFLVQKEEKNAKCLENIHLHKFQWGFIKKYYLKLQEVSKELSKWYVMLFLLSGLFIIGVIICQHLLMKESFDNQDFKQQTMKTTKNILYYYNNSIALGMKVNYDDMQLSYGYSNSFKQIDTIELALDLQGINDYLKGYTTYKYSLPSTIPGITYSKANYDMVVEFLSNAYMVKQFTDDSFMQSRSLSRARLSINSIFGASLAEYESYFTKQLSNMPKSYNNYILLAITITLLIGLSIVVIRLEYKLRQDQHKTLTLLSSIPNPDQSINLVKLFISKVTRQQINFIKYQNYDSRKDKNLIYNSSFAPDSTSKDVTRSEMSLREISGRDLLGQTFNRSGVLQVNKNMRQQQQFFSYQNREINISPMKRWVVILAILMSAIIACCILANQIGYNINGSIDEKTAVTNVFSIFSTSTFFSRSMILFLNLITSKQEVGVLTTTSFDNFIANYTQQKPLVVFMESTLPQFESFRKQLQQVQYQYMCSYIACDPLYAKDINIVYTSTIQKIIGSAQGWKQKFNAMNVSKLAASVKNGELSSLIHLIYYTQYTIRQQLINLVNIYFSCFSTYSSKLSEKKLILMIVGLLVTMICLLMLLGLIWYVVDQKAFLIDIANLIKTDSYFNEDNRIAEKQGARLSQ